MDHGPVVAPATQAPDWPRRRVWWRLWPGRGRLLLLALAGATMGAGPAADEAPFEAPFAHSPLTPPLVITGGFGEYRIGHFHAGFDFGTGHVVGKTVYAPLDGHIERLRASGVGYGRSIYLRARDGRLLQFGHLDAFAEPMGSWIAAIQDSTGQYEQDLWPEPTRFPVHAGQRIAWTGQSGAGGPHMHFEIRRGDMAYHPMRAGLVTIDESAPTLASVTLEPLDDTSYVEGSAGPVTRRMRAGAETLSVIGRVRAIVGARDGVWKGVDRMVPWLTRMEWGQSWIECRMDSVSWATDMVEGDYVFDAGRVVGEKGIVLWASRGFRPRFIRASAPLDQDAGTIEVRRGDPPLTLTLEARDLGGHSTRRTVVVEAATGGPAGDSARVRLWEGVERSTVALLPGGFVRYRGRMSGGGRSPWMVLHAPSVLGSPFVRHEQTSVKGASFGWELPYAARFDSSYYEAEWPTPHSSLPPAGAELVNAEPLLRLGPETLPLRASVKVRLPASGKPHAAVYRYDDDEWTWVGDRHPNGPYELESRRLGWFAEFEDTLGPRIRLRTPSRKPSLGAYSRWALEAGLVEKGSGVDARASHFVVNGQRVPTEWDPEADVLRWRPLKRPRAGTHRYDVVAADRAGNLSVRSGTFVLD